MKNREIIVLRDLDELGRAAAKKIVELAKAKTANGFSFTVALAGGSTPKRLYELLADENEPFRRSLEWGKIEFFWSDERCVAPDAADSNFRMANESLLGPLGISPDNIHRFRGEIDAETAAGDYDRFLRLRFNAYGNSSPRFDLILLGMGVDGHTASLFPHSDALFEKGKLAAAPYVEEVGAFRLTLTPPVLNNAANVIVQIAGEDKAATLREVLEGEYQPQDYPAQIVSPLNGNSFWFLDEAAAEALTVNRKYENFSGHLRR